MGVIQSSVNQALGTAAALKVISAKDKSNVMQKSPEVKPQLNTQQKAQIKQWDIMIDAMKAESLRIQAQNRANFLMKKMRKSKEEINKRRESDGKNTGLGNA